MVIDTSALIANLLGELDAEAFAESFDVFKEATKKPMFIIECVHRLLCNS